MRLESNTWVLRSGVADLHRELQAKAYRYMNPGVQEQEWGTREMTVIDPVGNHLIFSEPA